MLVKVWRLEKWSTVVSPLTSLTDSQYPGYPASTLPQYPGIGIPTRTRAVRAFGGDLGPPGTRVHNLVDRVSVYLRSQNSTLQDCVPEFKSNASRLCTRVPAEMRVAYRKDS
eukprot:365836-Rhodomonas_salina.1